MPQFVLFMREDNEKYRQLSPEEMKSVIEEHIAYANKLRADGRFVGGDGLKSGGRIVTMTDGKVNDNPYEDVKDVVGGYYIIEADSFDHAVEISKDCPALKTGDTLEIRQVMDY
jgi:hypothetical protein